MRNVQRKKPNKQRETLWGKIWKSLAALAIAAGIISPTNIKFDFSLIIIAVVLFVFFAVYWHFVEYTFDQMGVVKKFFLELQKDIKEIKKILKKGGKA